MSTERDAFVIAMDADPNDATARLVFADWLEEHGEEPAAVALRQRFTTNPRVVELDSNAGFGGQFSSHHRRFMMLSDGCENMTEFAHVAHACGVPTLGDQHPVYPTMFVDCVEFDGHEIECHYRPRHHAQRSQDPTDEAGHRWQR